MRIEKLNNKKILYCLIAIFTLLEIFLVIDNNGIWADEIFTMHVVDANWADATSLVLKDVHPPLYYILLKPFVDILSNIYPNRIVLAKLFSIIPFTLLLIFASKIIWKRYGYQTTYAYLLALFGTRVIMYAIEIRMYSLAMLFVTLAYLYANEIRLENKNKDWILFTIFSILGAYTHYYAVICLSLIYFYLLYFCIKEKCIKKWIICFAITCLSYVPWLIVLADQLTRVNEGWGSNLTFIDLAMFAIFPFYTNELISSGLIALICVIIVFCTIFNKKLKDKAYIIICQWNPVYVGIIGIIIALITHKFFTGKYMLPGWGIFWFGIILYVMNSKYKKVYLSLLICLNIFTYAISYAKENDDRQSYYALQTYVNSGEDLFLSAGAYEICEYYQWDLSNAKDLDEYENANDGYVIAYDRDAIDTTNLEKIDSLMLGGTPTTVYQFK